MWEVTGKDIVQLKMDGIWCLAHVHGDRVDYWSRHGKIKKTERRHPDQIEGKYIGELMFGSEWSQDPKRKGKFYVFDCLELSGLDVRQSTYRNRYQAMYLEQPQWVRLKAYPFHQAVTLWHDVVVARDYEGLVYRDSQGTWDETIFRQKATFTLDLEIVDFEEGQGRLKGTLGKLVASKSAENGLADSPLIHIGGGLSDALRAKIWGNQGIFSGAFIEVECKRIFKSGKLRHPNFVRFHPDKNPEDFINLYGTLK